MPSNIAAAAQSGDSSAISAAILSRSVDNGSVNAGRRAAEAANVSGSASGLEKIAEDIRAQNTTLREQQNLKAGASAIDRLNLAQLQGATKAGADELAHAREKVGRRINHSGGTQGPPGTLLLSDLDQLSTRHDKLGTLASRCNASLVDRKCNCAHLPLLCTISGLQSQ